MGKTPPRGRGGGGSRNPDIALVKQSGRSSTTTPDPFHAQLENELRARGVALARRLARKFHPARIQQAIRAWDLQIEAGEEVGAGLLVWYIVEGIEPRDAGSEKGWLERRYDAGRNP